MTARREVSLELARRREWRAANPFFPISDDAPGSRVSRTMAAGEPVVPADLAAAGSAGVRLTRYERFPRLAREIDRAIVLGLITACWALTIVLYLGFRDVFRSAF